MARRRTKVKSGTTPDVTPLNSGVACRDTATGSGYLLYSAESVHTRFSAHPPHPGNADHFICVVYSGGWQYDNNGGLYAFTPTGTDVLVAEVDFSADTVTDLKGQSSTQYGIAYGYVAGNLVFEANKWNGIPNPGEFTVTGTSFTVSGTIVKYCFFNGQRVAMRDDTGVYYLVGDHLGTTSVVLNANGTLHSEARHYPYGEERWSSGTLPTDYRFTGQREDAYIKLVAMGARWYDYELGRWISPDPIIPDFANPQSLNAYSYVYNQPLKLVDPTGRAGITAKLIRGAGKDYGALPYKGVVKVPDPDPVKTMRARAVARLVVSVAYEPADWAMTFHDWSQGDFSLWDLAGLLPLIPASGDNVIKAFRTAENLEDATKGGRLFRSLTKRNFRTNLRRLTGKSANDIADLEAHHVLPQMFKREFEEAGLDIHNPIFGSWVEASPHRHWSYEYNVKWQEFLEMDPTREEILGFAQQLAEEYGFDVHFEIP